MMMATRCERDDDGDDSVVCDLSRSSFVDHRLFFFVDMYHIRVYKIVCGLADLDCVLDKQFDMNLTYFGKLLLRKRKR